MLRFFINRAKSNLNTNLFQERFKELYNLQSTISVLQTKQDKTEPVEDF